MSVMRTDKAINDLAEIRQRLRLVDARASFRCVSLVIAGAVIIASAIWYSAMSPATAGAQIDTTASLAEPKSAGFVGFWMAVAGFCLTLVVVEVAWRSFSSRSRITFQLCQQIAVAMMPLVAVALLVTWASMDDPVMIDRLPGFWAVFAGLAIVSAGKYLPAICQLASFWWIIGGIVAIRYTAFFADHTTWLFSVLFGAGQLLLALCLFAGVKNELENV